MLDVLAVRYGRDMESIEAQWTTEQIELRYYWVMKQRLALIADERAAVLSALAVAFGSEK